MIKKDVIEMQRIFIGILTCLLFLASCGHQPTWQEQYDLGIRYLDEGNYEEAIIAFTAAIEIDPKQAPAYVGRGDAYIGTGETEENLNSALEDYLKATELEPDDADTYAKAAEVYILLGQIDEARSLLEQGFANTNSDILKSMLESLLLNEFGSTIFQERADYRQFENLTLDEQNLVSTVFNALSVQNKGALIQSVGLIEDSFSLYTMYDGYKMYIQNYYSEGKAQLVAEVRPENGMGYFCQIEVATDMSDFAVPDSTTSAEYFDYGYCPCENWQWNGTVHETDQRYWTYSDGPDQYLEDSIIAEVRDGLKTGEETETGSIGDIVNGSYIESIGSETIRVYENGCLVSERYRHRDQYSGGELGEWREVQLNISEDIVYSVQGGHTFHLQNGADRVWW